MLIRISFLSFSAVISVPFLDTDVIVPVSENNSDSTFITYVTRSFTMVVVSSVLLSPLTFSTEIYSKPRELLVVLTVVVESLNSIVC